MVDFSIFRRSKRVFKTEEVNKGLAPSFITKELTQLSVGLILLWILLLSPAFLSLLHNSCITSFLHSSSFPQGIFRSLCCMGLSMPLHTSKYFSHNGIGHQLYFLTINESQCVTFSVDFESQFHSLQSKKPSLQVCSDL